MKNHHMAKILEGVGNKSGGERRDDYRAAAKMEKRHTKKRSQRTWSYTFKRQSETENESLPS